MGTHKMYASPSSPSSGNSRESYSVKLSGGGVGELQEVKAWKLET